MGESGGKRVPGRKYSKGKTPAVEQVMRPESLRNRNKALADNSQTSEAARQRVRGKAGKSALSAGCSAGPGGLGGVETAGALESVTLGSNPKAT